jgi:hypothetical protein
MKKGMIVFITNSSALPETFEPEEVLTGLSLSYDRVLMAASTEGFWDIHGALHQLLTRGMQHISCIKARFNDLGQVETYGDPLRLYG